MEKDPIKKKKCKKIITKDLLGKAENGWLLEVVSDQDGFTDHLRGQIYLSVLGPFKKKGYHIHAGADYFVTCIKGNISSRVYTSKDDYTEFESGVDGFLTYRLPKGSAHFMENRENEEAYVLIYRYPAWSPDFQEQLDIEPEDIETDAAWTKIESFIKQFS